MRKGRIEGKPSAPQKILGKLKENRLSLHVARIPIKTREAFVALAEEEFCGDYGMALKWLIDDTVLQDTRMLIVQLENHEARIANLENSTTSVKDEDNSKKQVKMVSGKTIRVNKE
jgi:hypothetical protein